MNRVLLLVISLVFSCAVIAEEWDQQKVELAEKGVVSQSAGGEKEMTIIDENGNLKIVTPKKEAVPGPNITQQKPPAQVVPVKPMPAPAAATVPAPGQPPAGQAQPGTAVPAPGQPSAVVPTPGQPMPPPQGNAVPPTLPTHP